MQILSSGNADHVDQCQFSRNNICPLAAITTQTSSVIKPKALYIDISLKKHKYIHKFHKYNPNFSNPGFCKLPDYSKQSFASLAKELGEFYPCFSQPPNVLNQFPFTYRWFDESRFHCT